MNPTTEKLKKLMPNLKSFPADAILALRRSACSLTAFMVFTKKVRNCKMKLTIFVVIIQCDLVEAIRKGLKC